MSDFVRRLRLGDRLTSLFLAVVAILSAGAVFGYLIIFSEIGPWLAAPHLDLGIGPGLMMGTFFAVMGLGLCWLGAVMLRYTIDPGAADRKGGWARCDRCGHHLPSPTYPICPACGVDLAPPTEREMAQIGLDDSYAVPKWVTSRTATVGCAIVGLGALASALVLPVLANPAFAFRFWGVTVGMVVVTIALLRLGERLGLMPRPGIDRALATLVLGAFWLATWLMLVLSPG